jgi:hypothetical protein
MKAQMTGDGPLGHLFNFVQPTNFRPVFHRDHLLPPEPHYVVLRLRMAQNLPFGKLAG